MLRDPESGSHVSQLNYEHDRHVLRLKTHRGQDSSIGARAAECSHSTDADRYGKPPSSTALHQHVCGSRKKKGSSSKNRDDNPMYGPQSEPLQKGKALVT